MAVDDQVMTAMQNEIGNEVVEELGTVTRELIRRYAVAVGEKNLLYSDLEYAKSRRYADLVAPPNLVTSVITWNEGAPYDRLREDGTEMGNHLPGVPTSGVRMMGGGEQMTFVQPIIAGTIVHRTTVLETVERRTGSKGDLLVLTYRDTYADDADQPLLITLRTALLR